ncbi:MAG: MM0924 family protein [Acidobacteriota bacterium]
MEDLLKQLLGKKVDITCGINATFRGDVMDVKDGVVYLRDEDGEVAYVSVDKIAVVYEIKADHSRPGFIGS